jgi:hypothetical protein
MNPIASIGAGLLAAQGRFDQASTALSSAAAGGPGDIASAATDQIGAKIAFEAEAKVMKSISQTQKQVLDILA